MVIILSTKNIAVTTNGTSKERNNKEILMRGQKLLLNKVNALLLGKESSSSRQEENLLPDFPIKTLKQLDNFETALKQKNEVAEQFVSIN